MGNFRLLAKQAFKLDNVKLAASDYPDAVKELVVRSRLTFQDIHDRADIRFEELQMMLVIRTYLIIFAVIRTGWRIIPYQ